MNRTFLLVAVLFALSPACRAERDLASPTYDAVRVAAADSEAARLAPSVIQAKDKSTTVFDSAPTVPGEAVRAPNGEFLGTRKTYQTTDLRPPNDLDGPIAPAPKARKGLLDGGIGAMLPLAIGAGVGGWTGWLAAGALGVSTWAGLAFGGGVGLAGAFLVANGQPLAGLGLIGGVLLGAFLFPANPILGGLAIGLGLAAAGYFAGNLLGIGK